MAKLYAESDGQSFSAFGRIYSGTVKPGKRVTINIMVVPPFEETPFEFVV